MLSHRWRRFWRSGLMFSDCLWRRCVSWTIPKRSSGAPSSLTTSFAVCEPRSCCRATTGTSHQTQRSPAPPVSHRPASSTGPRPHGSASRLRPDRPSESGSGPLDQDRSSAPAAPRRAAASTRRRRRRRQDATSTCRSPSTTRRCPPARPHPAPHCCTWLDAANWTRLWTTKRRNQEEKVRLARLRTG